MSIVLYRSSVLTLQKAMLIVTVQTEQYKYGKRLVTHYFVKSLFVQREQEGNYC